LRFNRVFDSHHSTRFRPCKPAGGYVGTAWRASSWGSQTTIFRLDLGYVQANTSRVKVRALVSSFLLAAVSIGAASAGPQQPAAPSQASEPEIKITPSETVIYEFARTLIDWTPQQIRDCPSLRKLRPAGSQDQLPMILERAGQTGDTVFRDFPQVSCDEVLTSET